MCNHAFGEAANCKISPTPGGVSLVTRRALLAGEECLIDYGALSNDFLLLDYVRLSPSCHKGTDRTLLDVVRSAAVIFCFIWAAWPCVAPLGVFVRPAPCHGTHLVISPRHSQAKSGAGVCDHGQPARPTKFHVPKGASGGVQALAIPLLYSA